MLSTENRQDAKPLYVSIAGVMGSGKTTASNLLAKTLGFDLFEETGLENKFLPLYYKDPKRWSLHSQLFYLHQRAEQLSKIHLLLAQNSIIQDSPIYQDYLTYAKAQYILGHMNHDEFSLYEKYFRALNEHILIPNLIVQLNTSVDTLASRIKKRNRDYEKTIDKPYLELLSKLQTEWVNTHPNLDILTVNTDNLDLASNPNHQKQFVSLVKSKLGLDT